MKNMKSEKKEAKKFTNSAEYMKIAAFRELKDALQVKRVNDELLEFLAASLRWILHYCERNKIPIPDRNKINELMDRAIEIEKKLPSQYISDENYHPDDEDDDRHEVNSTLLLVLSP
jgi:hypothetical protein